MVDRTVMQSGRYKAYPEYKDSGVEWLGEIPSAWSLLKLKRVIREHSGNGFPIELQKDGNGVIPFLKVSDISGKEKYIDSPANFVSLENIRRYRWNMVPKGSIVTGKIGEALRKNHRKILLVDSVIDNNCIGIEPTKILSDFNFYAHKLIDFDWYVNPGAVPSISVQKYKKEYLAIPSLNEQEKIISFLDHETAKIDTLIEKQQRLIELLVEKRQAVISHAVTKGLNPDAPMKDSGVEWLGEVPEHWGVKPLKYLVSEPLQYGANEAAIDTDISQPRFVRITDVLPNGDLKKDTFRSLSYEVAKPYMLKDGDVLLARSGGTVGKSFIYRDTWGKCCFAGYLIKARINERFIPAEWFYLNTLTDFYWSWIESIQIQATIQNVSADKYNAFFIAIPPISEAEEIIPYIEKNLNMFDALISKAEQAIQLMQERRTALISAAVTGKIDVRDWDVHVASEVCS